MRRCLEVARASGARTAILETRYLDLDYRSEYSAFYSRSFGAVPDNARRLHFFGTSIAEADLASLGSAPGYLGYVVIRPTQLGLVGRTMLTPPPDLRDMVRTAVTDRVSLFGQELSVTAMPFVEQNAELGRCAHAAAWMCHFAASLRGDAGRRALAEFSLAANPALSVSRPIPSTGLTLFQISDVLREFGLPPIHYNIARLPNLTRLPWSPPDPVRPPQGELRSHGGYWDHRIIPICCRFLNSGFPIIVTNREHAFVLCGFGRRQRLGDRDWISFVRHDDQRGPYLPVENVLDDWDVETRYEYSPWENLLAPVPEKLWLGPDEVEAAAARYLIAVARQISEDAVHVSSRVLEMAEGGTLALRTYATRSNDFKRDLVARGVPDDLVRAYRLARFSRLIWVVEIVDRTLRAAGPDCVLGEAIFDGTSSEFKPAPLVLHVPGIALIYRTSGAVLPVACDASAYRTGGIGPA